MGSPRTLLALGIAAGLLAGGAPRVRAFGGSEKGTSGAQFLKIAPGARAAAMGEAFSAVADDATAAYYNPAGLGRLRRIELAAMRNQRFQGISHNYGVVALPMLSWKDTRRARNAMGVLALSLTSLSVDGIERRGVVETDEPDGTFEASDFAYTMAYGLDLNPRLSLGGAVKYISQRIDSEGASAFGMDAGGLYRMDKRLTFALGSRNAGSQIQFRDEGDPLPFLVYTGASYRIIPQWLAAAEVRIPRDNALALSLGTEYRKQFTEELSASLRGGFNSSRLDVEGFSGISMGAGAAFRKVEFDFAWVPYGDLGATFQYSILVRF